jgi:hypothetical protein
VKLGLLRSNEDAACVLEIMRCMKASPQYLAIAPMYSIMPCAIFGRAERQEMSNGYVGGCDNWHRSWSERVVSTQNPVVRN